MLSTYQLTDLKVYIYTYIFLSQKLKCWSLKASHHIYLYFQSQIFHYSTAIQRAFLWKEEHEISYPWVELSIFSSFCLFCFFFQSQYLRLFENLEQGWMAFLWRIIWIDRQHQDSYLSMYWPVPAASSLYRSTASASVLWVMLYWKNVLCC